MIEHEYGNNGDEEQFRGIEITTAKTITTKAGRHRSRNIIGRHNTSHAGTYFWGQSNSRVLGLVCANKPNSNSVGARPAQTKWPVSSKVSIG